MDTSEEGANVERGRPTKLNSQIVRMQIFELPGALRITQYNSFILQMRKMNSRELLWKPLLG